MPRMRLAQLIAVMEEMAPTRHAESWDNVGLLAGRVREGWWTSPYRDELLGRAEGFEESATEIWVVFDGAQPRQSGGTGRVRSVFAPSADEWLIARIRERDPAQVALVTADRQLAARARQRGVEVVAPAAFLARCRALGGAAAARENA